VSERAKERKKEREADHGENDDDVDGGDDVGKALGSSSDGGGEEEGGVIWFEAREGKGRGGGGLSLAGWLACLLALLCFALRTFWLPSLCRPVKCTAWPSYSPLYSSAQVPRSPPPRGPPPVWWGPQGLLLN
jgi:hypothetical protein